eukprot:1161186-Pelagomonas_calceolata.AAC.3
MDTGEKGLKFVIFACCRLCIRVCKGGSGALGLQTLHKSMQRRSRSLGFADLASEHAKEEMEPWVLTSHAQTGHKCCHGQKRIGINPSVCILISFETAYGIGIPRFMITMESTTGSCRLSSVRGR